MTGHYPHAFFKVPKLESSLCTHQKNLSLAYPGQCLQLQLIYYFSFIAFV